MAKGWKMLDWFRESRPAQESEPTPMPEEPAPAEEEPAFDLFPEESAKGEKRSTDRRPLGVAGSLVSGSYTTPDPINVRDISPQGRSEYGASNRGSIIGYGSFCQFFPGRLRDNAGHCAPVSVFPTGTGPVWALRIPVPTGDTAGSESGASAPPEIRNAMP